MSKKFVNLHTHTHYSLLDGLPQIENLISRAKELDYPALAITDHGAMYGAIEFYKAAGKAGIKPIIGVEAYLAKEHRTKKSGKMGDNYNHLTLIAENNQGYKNLMKLVTRGFLEGFYYKPRIDKESLKELSDGLICLSGCLGGELASAISEDRPADEIQKVLESYIEIFGEKNMFLEVQSHPNLKEHEKVNGVLKELGKNYGIPRVATLDSHYLRPEDAEAQDALICVGTGKMVSDTDRLDMRDVDLSLKSGDEVLKMFDGDEEVIDTSLKIAQRCDAAIDLDQRYFPTFEIPDGKSPADYLRENTYEGLEIKYKDREITQEVKNRIEYELKVINDKGYATYFLVVADFVNWMHGQDIITTTRGSAAGCMVSYCLGITNIDPIDYNLPFERFLNPYRPSAPDIDIDIADNRRSEVIEYVTQKYGKDKVAQIITFGKMLARAAVRDIGRVLGVPYAKCDEIAKLIPPPRQGFPMPMERALETVPELKQMYKSDPEAKRILDLVKKVEGTARHSSVHAAGVVISPTPLTNYTPLQKDVNGEGTVTQYDMHACEDIGLVKMDFLGIRNLSILGNAVEIIKKKHGIEIDLENIPLDDKKTFQLLAKGETVGLFQVGGSGMTTYLKDLKPTSIFDISAMIALYRPGPMEAIPEYIRRKHNPKLVKYLDPRMEKYLDKSYGLIVYQDDLLFSAIELAGYDWEETDKFRKAVGKKIPAEMAAQKEKLISGIIRNGQSREFAEKLWELFEPFQAYGFNKAHAASYALVTYQTAYLKANYPAEYMAAVLTAESHDLDKVAAAVEECERMDIKVLPPDINESFKMFAVINDKTIRWALTAVKNVGHDVVSAIIAERKQNGLYTSFQDFIGRLDTKYLNRKGLESLIRCGAFDNMGERNTLLENLDSILEAARSAKRAMVEGQASLFIAGDKKISPLSRFALKPAESMTKSEVLSWEKELLGLYISAHPLEEDKALFEKLTAIKHIHGLPERTEVCFGGVITKTHKITTRKGEAMAFLTFEDLTGSIECICFPRIYTESMKLIDGDAKMIVTGKISEKDGDTKVLIDSLKVLNEKNLPQVKPGDRVSPSPGAGRAGEGLPSPDSKIAVNIPASAETAIFSQLKEVFEKHPGNSRVVLLIPDPTGKQRHIATSYKVSVNDELKKGVKEILLTYNKQ